MNYNNYDTPIIIPSTPHNICTTLYRLHCVLRPTVSRHLSHPATSYPFFRQSSQNFEFLANGAMCNSNRQFDNIKSCRFNFVTNCSLELDIDA